MSVNIDLMHTNLLGVIVNRTNIYFCSCANQVQLFKSYSNVRAPDSPTFRDKHRRRRETFHHSHRRRLSHSHHRGIPSSINIGEGRVGLIECHRGADTFAVAAALAPFAEFRSTQTFCVTFTSSFKNTSDLNSCDVTRRGMVCFLQGFLLEKLASSSSTSGSLDYKPVFF